MLSLLVSVALALGLAHGSAIRSDSGYGSGSSGYGYSNRNYYGEISDARNRIVVLGANDVLINTRLDGVKVKIDLVTDFRQQFVNNIFDNIRQAVADNDALIDSITAELKALMVLVDEVDALGVQVNNLLDDLKDIRNVRVDTDSDLSRLEDADTVQNQQIADLEQQIDVQDERIVDASQRVTANEVLAREVYANLVNVVDIVNQEKSETFTVEVTPENSSVTIPFASAFSVVPSISYGIVDLDVSEVPSKTPAYGQSYEPTYPSDEVLSGQVNVVSNENSFTVTLEDSSDQWVFNSITVRVTAYVIDNSQLSYQGDH